MRKHLNKSSRQYANEMDPGIHKAGLKIAGLVFFSVLASEIILNSILVHKYAKDYGNSFKKEWIRYNNGQMSVYLFGPLGFALFFFILAELEFAGATEEFKCYAAKAVKRYIHDAHIKGANLDEETLRDIANLIIANMTKDERESVIEIGLALDEELSKIDLQNDVVRSKTLVRAQAKAAKVMDSVLGRYPDLSDLILKVINGQMKSVPTLIIAQQNQK